MGSLLWGRKQTRGRAVENESFETRVRPIHRSDQKATYDISIRKRIRRERDALRPTPTPGEISVRVTITVEDIEADLEHSYASTLTDHRYILAKVRQTLREAVSAPWSEQDSKTIHHPGPLTDLGREPL